MNLASAYIPFITPLNWFHDTWFLLAIPMAFLLAMSYKAIRVRDLNHYWRQVAIMTGQILLGLTLLGAGLYAIIEWVVPHLPV